MAATPWSRSVLLNSCTSSTSPSTSSTPPTPNLQLSRYST
jgi:hypothetical protein